MSSPTAVAQRFYDVIARSDGQALFDLLTEDFEGVVSTGMPHGFGGEYHGPADMITAVWARIEELYDVRVHPSEFLSVDDEKVVVLGHYRGPARDGDSTVDAAFAHVITTRGDRIAALTQITDTERWSIPAV